MEFLKNHYEKVVLSVVLLALAVAVAILPMKVPSGADESSTAVATNPPVKLGAVNLTTNESAIQSLEKLPPVVLSGTNNLFNPVLWKRNADGSLLKIDADNLEGIGAVKVRKIDNLYFKLSFEGYKQGRFQIGVMQQTNKSPTLRGTSVSFCSLNEKKEFYRVLGGEPPDNPTNVVMELNDGKTVTVSKESPYQVVAGYTTDLVYKNMPFPQRRIGDILFIEQETNNIVDISSNAVVLSSNSGKRVKLNYQAVP